MKIKVIFLDIDGVLKDITDVHFNSRNIDNLNELIRKTGAKIVVTSTWKNMEGLDYIRKVLNDKGVNGEIIDVTPTFYVNHSEYGDNQKVPRGMEIKSWLEKFTSFDGESDINFVESYVILDDHLDMLIEQIDNFVKVDPTKGFDGKHLKEALEILGRSNVITI